MLMSFFLLVFFVNMITNQVNKDHVLIVIDSQLYYSLVSLISLLQFRIDFAD